MNRVISRLQIVMLEHRTIRAIVWFVAIGALIYLTSAFWFGWQEAVMAFTALGLKTLVVGAILSSTSYLWRFGRWEYSLRYLRNTVPVFLNLGVYLAGLALTATPGKAGETFRSALLIHHGVKASQSLAAFLVDRGTDVLGVILLGTLSSIMLGQHVAGLWLFSFVAIFLGSCLFAYTLSKPSGKVFWSRLDCLKKWVPVEGGKVTLEAWAKVWTLPKVVVFTVVAMFAYGTQALVFSWFCSVLETGISIADCILIFVQATLFGAASMIPGGLGAMEAALVLQLVEHGVSDGVAMSLAISIRLVTLWFGMLLGVLSLLLSTQYLKSEQESSER